MIDRGGRARLTILAPPWAVRKKYVEDSPMMIQTDNMAGPEAPMMNMFSFGVVVMEVRPVYLAAYSIV